MSENTTPKLSLRDEYNALFADATKLVADALTEVTANTDMEKADDLVSAYLSAKEALALVIASGASLASQEKAEAEDADLVKAIKAVLKKRNIDAFPFKFDGANAIERKATVSRTGGSIGQRSTLTFQVNALAPMGVTAFMKEYGKEALDNPTGLKAWGNNVTHPKFYASTVARLRKAGNTVILTEGEHPAESHKHDKNGYKAWLDHHTKRIGATTAVTSS